MSVAPFVKTIMETSQSKKSVYLDYAAAAPLDPEVCSAMQEVSLSIFGNPSSMHHQGRAAFDILEAARTRIAKCIAAKPTEIVFTASGTESDNLALYGVTKAYQEHGQHIIVSAIEHKAILNVAKRLESEGFSVTYIPVDKVGLVDVGSVLAAIRPDTTLVSVMYANSEIGTTEPITKLAAALKGSKEKPLLHTDATQAAEFLSLSTDELGVDLMTLNSAKVYGPKGIGLLYVKEGVDIKPLVVGGDQEVGVRAGTESVVLAHGFSIALEKACNLRESTSHKLLELRDYFIDGLKNLNADIVFNGDLKGRLPNNINISIPYLEGESLVLLLDHYGICCATGSACSTNDLTPSHVLRAIGVSDELIHGSLRFSLGRNTTKDEIDYTIQCLEKCINTLMQITAVPFVDNKNLV